MKQLILLLTACILLAGCGQTNGGASEAEASAPPSSIDDSAQLPNPFEEHATVEEAREAAGFDFHIPQALPDGYAQASVSLMRLPDEMGFAQVIYEDAGGGQLTWRTSDTMQPAELNGDDNEYGEEEIRTIGGHSVTVLGEPGAASVLYWEGRSAGYCVMASPPLGYDDLEALVESVG